jgi:hypothetical protein
MGKKTFLLVCPECLSFDTDFPSKAKANDYCPYCWRMENQTEPKLRVVSLRDFHKMIAVKLWKEMLE